MQTYPGNLAQDCAAVAKPNLESKIKKALSECVEVDAIYGFDNFGAWHQGFSVKGIRYFYDTLLANLTAAEKHELLNEYVLTWTDAQTASICDGLISEFGNPLRVYAKDAARRILDQHADHVSSELRRMERAA